MLTPDLTNPLRGLILPRDSRSKRVSSWATSGGNADYWPLEPGETKTIADIAGPGCINHIWMTSGSDEPAWPRRVLLRFFWDDMDIPGVEVPLGDGEHLAATHGHRETILDGLIGGQQFPYVCHGHSHRVRDERIGRTRVINPGALHHAKVHTIAMLDTDTDMLEHIIVH